MTRRELWTFGAMLAAAIGLLWWAYTGFAT